MMLDEIREASSTLLRNEKAEAKKVSETTPRAITPAIIEFVSSFADQPPVFIPVVNDPHGLYGWCSDGVREKVRVDGGKPVFGWTIWEWPNVMLTAEFHCVWQNDTGDVQDITPKPKEEKTILFVADPAYETDFDFDNRPGNKRTRIYIEADRTEKALAIKNSLSGAKLQYEQTRANKADLTLDGWLLGKIPLDPLPKAIDDLINACNAHEAYLDTLGVAGAVEMDGELLELSQKRLIAQNRFKNLMRS